MKTTKILLIIFMIGLVLVSCGIDDDSISGTIEVGVTFDEAKKGADEMIMAYLWEGSTFSAAQDAGTVDSYMFSFGSDTLLPNSTLMVKFEDLSEGNYYCGIFEAHEMPFHDDAEIMGYYCADSTNTTGSANPSAIEISSGNEMQTIAITVSHHGGH